MCSNNVLRFNNYSDIEINDAIEECVPKNTRKTKASIWKQFEIFCAERKYKNCKISKCLFFYKE